MTYSQLQKPIAANDEESREWQPSRNLTNKEILLKVSFRECSTISGETPAVDFHLPQVQFEVLL